jgi:serine/threonine-protein kinase
MAALAGGAAAFASTPARAQDDTTSAAQTLFAQASEKLDQRDFKAACPMLEEVLRLEPGANGARLALAECYEGSGRLANAHKTYSIVAATAARLGQTDRQSKAEARARALQTRLGAVIVQVAPAVRGVAGLTIRVCGEALAADGYDRPRPADRGTCKVAATAPGKVPWERTLEVTDGATTSVTLDRLDDVSSPAGPQPPSPAREGRPAPIAPPATPPAPAPDRSHRGQLGALVRVDIDVLNAGAVAAVGASYAPSDHIEVGLSGLLGKRAGFEPAVTGYLLTGAVKPFVNVGAPVLFDGGPYMGIRGAVGAQWDPHRHVGFFATVGAAYFPDVPKGYTHAVLLPALGVQGRL